jgi:hypothetical protein
MPELVEAPTDDTPTMGRDLLRADDIDNGPSVDLGEYANVAMDANAMLNNPLTEGILSSGPGTSFETPFQHRLRQRARRAKWNERWERLRSSFRRT